MKKNEKGFTLIELLAVIVILGIIMSIAGMSLLKQKKDANEKELESIYNSIKQLGADVYLNEKESIESIDSDKVYVSQYPLIGKGYLKSAIKNPAGNGYCDDVYLLINKTSNNDMFEAYVKCDGFKAKGRTDPTDQKNGYTALDM